MHKSAHWIFRNLPATFTAFVVILLGVLTPDAFSQTQVLIGASKDNTLYESPTGALSNGAGAYFFSGRTDQATGSIRRGLIAFNIGAVIPTNATITSATLTLNCSQTTSGGENIELRRALADWGEGTSVATGQQGRGGPSTTGDATWVHRFFPGINWSTPGGQFSATVSGSETVSGIGSYTWASTSQIVNDVQFWLANPTQNFGWVLLGNEALAHTAKRFDTKEISPPSTAPVLTVDYTTTVDVRAGETTVAEFALHPSYPNPFNPSTTLSFSVDSRGHVSLLIVDLLGREVATLFDEEVGAGTYSVRWDASAVANGMYFAQLASGGKLQSQKLMLLK